MDAMRLVEHVLAAHVGLAHHPTTQEALLVAYVAPDIDVRSVTFS